MGIYDTFIDGEKSVQLKNFEPNMRSYTKGDTIPVEKFRYPKSCSFVCFAQGDDFVVVENGVFTKITSDKREIIFPLYSCHGELVASSLREFTKVPIPKEMKEALEVKQVPCPVCGEPLLCPKCNSDAINEIATERGIENQEAKREARD